MKRIFSEHAWDDYVFWQRTDPRVVKRINALIRQKIEKKLNVRHSKARGNRNR